MTLNWSEKHNLHGHLSTFRAENTHKYLQGYELCECYAYLKYNIKENLHGNVSTTSDVSVKRVMSVVSLVRNLFYYTI